MVNFGSIVVFSPGKVEPPKKTKKKAEKIKNELKNRSKQTNKPTTEPTRNWLKLKKNMNSIRDETEKKLIKKKQKKIKPSLNQTDQHKTKPKKHDHNKTKKKQKLENVTKSKQRINQNRIE